MRRALPWLLLMVWTAVSVAPVAQAQAPSPPGLRTITGSDGSYQFQIPSDWQQQFRSFSAQAQSLDIRLDLAFDSPDGAEHAVVEVATGPGAARLAAPTNLLAIIAAYEATFQASESGTGSSIFDVFSGPAPAEIANADVGMRASAVYADPDGNPRVLTLSVAGQGRTAYFFFVDVTEDFYESDPSFSAILNSFQLSPPPGGVPASRAPFP